MRFLTSRTRIATAVAGLAAAATAVAPLAAQACGDAGSAPLGYGNLAHSSDVTAAGVPVSVRGGARGTYADFGYGLPCSPSPLATLLPREHGTVYWLDYYRSGGPYEAGIQQEVTQATSPQAAHDVGMALYDGVKECSGSARHAIAIDGGSITWFLVADGPYRSTVSVIRVGARVSVVALRPGPAGHARTVLLTKLADRMR